MRDPTKGNAMKPMNDLLTRQVKWLAVALIAAAGTAYDAAPAKAGKGGAFLGGILAGHVVGGFVRRDKARTQAEMYQAYRPQQPARPDRSSDTKTANPSYLPPKEELPSHRQSNLFAYVMIVSYQNCWIFQL